jgi:hypothetical protein
MKKRFFYLSILPLMMVLSSCGIYSFTGGSISVGMKTVSVILFDNNSQLVVPTLSQSFTEALKDRIRTQTGLSFLRNDGDANFTGSITNYSITPVAIQGNQQNTAGLTRLSITVQVKYTNKIELEKSFEQSFTRFLDFSTQSGAFASQEQSLIKNINQQLTEDIYNRAFANW